MLTSLSSEAIPRYHVTLSDQVEVKRELAFMPAEE